MKAGHSTTGQIARLIEFFPSYLVFKKENVKVKVNYGFVLHTGFSGSPPPTTLELSSPT
jgi:hypothetical protein